MSTRNQALIVHPWTGGLDTTKAPTLLTPDQLVTATNIEYDTSGARRKRLGTTRYNATQVTAAGSGTAFTAVADFWRFGTSLTATQDVVAHSGTTIYKDDADGVWDSIVTSWGTGTSRVNITIAQGFAVVSNDNNNIPQTWDQTTAADLNGAGTPRFEACVYHLRRLWTIGEQTATSGNANPSRSTVSAGSDITDFTGTDATSFIFDEDDGDRLNGVSKPFHNRLYFFKGPIVGSIHEVTGTTLSTFQRNKVHSGIPCVAHKGIITTANDIYWPSPFGIHSLQATIKYGDTEEAFLSRPIQATYRGLNLARLNQIQGFYHHHRNIVGWSVPNAGSTVNNLVLVYNFALGLWSTWTFTNFNAASFGVLRTPSTQVPRLYIGDYNGYVHTGDQTTLSDDNADQAYTATIKTGVIGRWAEGATELHEKQLYSVTTFFRPKGDYNATLTATVDRRNQTATVNMAGAGDTLG